MKNKLLLSFALLQSLFVTCLAADIQLPLVASGAHDTIRSSMPESASASPKQPSSVTKLPADLVAPKFGQFTFGPKESPMTIAFAFDDPPGKPGRLLIDANGNGDLTDDAAPEWSIRDMERNGKPCRYGSGSVMLYLAKGDEASKVRVKLYRYVGSEPSMRGDLQYYPDYARIGKVELDGKTYGAILHDEYASGDYRHFAVTIKLDLNGDGPFDGRTESFRASDPFKVGDTVYEVTGITANGSSFQIVKSTRPVPERKVSTPPVATVQPGNPAPVFEATTITGQKISFPGSYKGKLVLLDFWATWCGPCIGELPNLIKAYEAHHAKGLEVLGISLDSEKAVATLPDFLKAKNMVWPQICDGKGWSAELGRLYGVRSIPAAFLIDGTTGIVLATQGLRGAQLSDTIEAALSKKLTPANAGNATASRRSVSFSAASLAGSKWSGGTNFWIEFRANGDYREFWRNAEYPGTWKVLGEKEVSVSRKDGWDYVFKPTPDGALLRVWKPKPGQEQQENLVFQPMAVPGAASSRTRSGIVAVWQANGDAVENVSGQKGDLRSVAFAEGVLGKAFDITGPASAVVMSESALNQNFSAMTIAAWVKARSLGRGDYDGFGRTIISRTEDGGFALRVLDGRIQLDLRTEDGGVHKLLFQHPPLPLNTWAHVAATYDGKMATAYVDGKQAGNSLPVSGRIKKTTRPSARLMIGNEPGTVPNEPAGIIQPGNFQWDGLLDQVAVYENALSAAEIENVRVRSRGASLTAGDGTNRNHMSEIMRIAATDRDGALKTILDGLRDDPLKNPWGLEVSMIFKSDERRALSLKGDEKTKLLTQCRDYIVRARALSEEALKKHPSDTSLSHGLGALDEALARASLELGDTAKAKELAAKQLATNTDTKSWNYGNVIHEANCALGRAALRDGDKKAAADFLKRAGATPGSPQLNSFGPDWTFAREMFEAGETKAVLDYFDLVEKFWAQPKPDSSRFASLSTRHKQKLDQWRAEVRAGKMPDFKP